MFFGDVKTESSLGCILSTSIEIYKDKNKIKISKGTVINKVLIDLLLLNDIGHVKCAKLDDDEIDEKQKNTLKELKELLKSIVQN